MTIQEHPTGVREGFASTRPGGLRWDSLPMRLFVGGNRKFWNPADLDFTQDAIDYAESEPEAQKLTRMLATLFMAGEEAVTEDIQPFLRAMAAEGRVEDEIYLTQFAFEEAKHTEGFRRWLDAVGVDDDLNELVSNSRFYRVLFYDALPTTLRVLEHDHSPRAQVRASVLYNHVIEGTLALTGYYAWNRICEAGGVLPGMRQLIRNIASDERRHMAWGTFTCRRHVAADKAMWDLVQETMDEYTPIVLEGLYELFDEIDFEQLDLSRLDPEGDGQGQSPEELMEEFANYAADRMGRRLNAIETALSLEPSDIEVDRRPEELEDEFAAEDEAAFQQRLAAGQVG